MQDWLGYVVLLGVLGWGIWHFGRMLWVGVSTGRVIGPRAPNREPVTRDQQPVRFWYSMALALLFVLLFSWGVAFALGRLAGLWES